MNLAQLRVFLAAPYSQWMDPATGRVRDDWRSRLDWLRVSLINAGARVFSAHHNEEWGAGWLPADQCTVADFRAMRVADIVCAVVGNPPSGGVTVELGWASAMSKPIVLIKDPDVSYSPLIDGIGSITRATTMVDAPVWDEEFFEDLVAHMRLVLSAKDAVTPLHEGTPEFIGLTEGASHT